MKKTLIKIVAVVAMMAIVLSFAGCSSEAAEKNVQYTATNSVGTMTVQEGLGNIIRTQGGFLTLYDDGTYELVTDSIQYADWGSVVVATFMAKQYGTWTSELSDEFGVQAKLSVPERIVLATSMWDMALTYGGAEEGAAFENTSLIKDTATLSESDKALFDLCLGVLASQANILTAETTFEITNETATYEVVG